VSATNCSHLDTIKSVEPGSNGCQECLQMGDRWFHLRICMACGHVGCCDNSTNRHATRHAFDMKHPIIRSFEPGEEWLWCYADQLLFELDCLQPGPWHT
jgi:hypothetical protein